MKDSIKTKFNEITAILKNFFRAWKMEYKNSPKLSITSVVLKFIVSWLPLLQLYYFSLIVNQIQVYFSTNTLDKNLLYYNLGLTIVLSLVVAILWTFISKIDDSLWKRNAILFQQHVYYKVSTLDLETFETPKFHTDFNKVKDMSEWKLSDFLEKGKWVLFHDIIGICLSLYIVINIKYWFIFLIIVITLPEIYLQMREATLKWSIYLLKPEIKNRYYDTLKYLASDNYFKEIRMFGLSSQLSNIVRKTSTEFLNDQQSFTKKSIKFIIPTKIVEVGGLAYIQWTLLQDIINNKLKIGDFGFINSAILEFANKAKNFAHNITRLFEANLFVQTYFGIIDIESKINLNNKGIKLDKNIIPKIEFRNVSFKYPNTEKYVYENLNIIINPGDDIALVGENGAGKTTFVKLLARFYDVTEGQILVNGINIKDLNLKSWLDNLGILFQDFNKYAYSVKENIELGIAESKISNDELAKYGQQAGASEFIESYDKKYETVLSKAYDGGTEPSGGQWQRIALARAFYRNANVLILDEPTSAIDAKGEYEIFKEIEKTQENKTTIIISHRFSTVRNADKIYVIEHGKIIEHGTHDCLLEKGGLYKKMFEMQAEGYK